MPNIKSADKRNRQSLKLRARNRIYKSNVRTAKNRFLAAVKAEDKELAGSAFQTFIKIMDTAQGKGVYHKNTAARKKSRLHKMLNSLG